MTRIYIALFCRIRRYLYRIPHSCKHGSIPKIQIPQLFSRHFPVNGTREDINPPGRFPLSHDLRAQDPAAFGMIHEFNGDRTRRRIIPGVASRLDKLRLI